VSVAARACVSTSESRRLPAQLNSYPGPTDRCSPTLLNAVAHSRTQPARSTSMCASPARTMSRSSFDNGWDEHGLESCLRSVLHHARSGGTGCCTSSTSLTTPWWRLTSIQSGGGTRIQISCRAQHVSMRNSGASMTISIDGETVDLSEYWSPRDAIQRLRHGGEGERLICLAPSR